MARTSPEGALVLPEHKGLQVVLGGGLITLLLHIPEKVSALSPSTCLAAFRQHFSLKFERRIQLGIYFNILIQILDEVLSHIIVKLFAVYCRAKLHTLLEVLVGV